MNHSQPFRLFLFCNAIVFAGGLTVTARCAEFWRIGPSEQTPPSLLRATGPAFVHDIGGPAAAQPWPGYQMASNDAPAVYSVRFTLPEAPHEPPVLAMDIYFTSMSPGTIVVSVNGTEGRFLIRPEKGTARNYEQANATTFSAQKVRAAIPPALLRAGSNEIGVSFTDLPAKLKGEVTAVESRIGSVSYDSLALLSSSEIAIPAVSVVPSIFFKRAPDGLVELTDVVVRHDQPFKSGRVKLTVAGVTTVSDLQASSAAFGEERFELAVPVIESAVPCKVVVEIDGVSREYEAAFKPAKRWTLHAALQNHSDIGYTDYQPGVEEVHDRNVDSILRVLDSHPQHKFVLESTWLAESFLNSRSPEEQKRFLDHVRAGRIEISPFYLNILTGLCTGEELHRALYPAAKLQRESGIPVRAATMTDIPSYSWFIPGLLADAGVGSFSIGSNQHRGQILMGSDLAEISPFYWEGADGRRVLVWYTRVYGQILRLVGDVGTPERLRRALPQFMTRFSGDEYPWDRLLLYGLYGDNMDVKDGEVKLFEDWSREYAFPRLVPSTQAEFFDHVRAGDMAKIPVRRGDGGAYWEDGSASSAAETIMNRDSQRLLPAAEMVSAFAAALTPGQHYPQEKFDDAWRNVLFYDEHTWGANRSVSQPDRDIVRGQWEFKQAFARRGNIAAKTLWLGGMARLAQQLTVEGQTLVVFNPDARTRTAVVETDLDPGMMLIDPQTGDAVGTTIVARKNGFDTVRFVAEDVPGIGYRSYTLKRGPAGAPPASTDSWEIRSRHYRVKLDPASGAVSELMDLDLDRELVDKKSPFGLNRLIYVTGGEGTRVANNNTAPEAVLERHPAGSAVLVSNTGDSITVRTSAPNFPEIESTITVYDSIKRVDIVNRVVKEETRDKEAVYFAFPFNVGSPELSVESQEGWVRPNVDQLPGAAREWFATQNAVVARGDGVAVAWASPDAPLCTLTEINRGLWLGELPVTNAHVFSYVMHNYWTTNYKASQAGEMCFRYSITSAPSLSEAEAGRFSADTRFPPLAFQLVHAGSNRVQAVDRVMPAGRGAFLEVDPAHVQVSAFKRAEDGDGYILRLREIAGSDGPVCLVSPVLGLVAVSETNAIEVDSSVLTVEGGRAVSLPVGAHRYAAFRIHFAPPAPTPASHD